MRRLKTPFQVAWSHKVVALPPAVLFGWGLHRRDFKEAAVAVATYLVVLLFFAINDLLFEGEGKKHD
jgi:hypothetical protein